MLCKNCGANLPDGTPFCGSCGAKQDVQSQAAAPVSPMGGYTPQLNLNGFAFGNVSGMRLIGAIAMAVAFIILLTEYVFIGMSANGRSNTQGFNCFDFLEENFIGKDAAGGYKIVMYLIALSNVIALAACVGFIVFTFLNGPSANTVAAIKKCEMCATVACISLAVGLVLAFIMPSPFPDTEQFAQYRKMISVSGGYEFQGYIALALACAVRFYTVPESLKTTQG